MVGLLLEHGADQNFKIKADVYGRSDGLSLVSYPAWQNNIEMVETLMKYADIDNHGDHKYNGPLIFAVHNENLEMVQLLLDAGADVDAADGAEGEERSALGIAVDIGSRPMVELLLENGASLYYRVNGETPMDIAECNGEKEIFKIPREYGARKWRTFADSTLLERDSEGEEEMDDGEMDTEMDIDSRCDDEDDEDEDDEQEVIEDDSDDGMVEF